MLHSLLKPTSIAVVGVSLDPAKVGHQIFVNLQHFKGHLYAVHPTLQKVLGKPVYKDILSIPQSVDVCVIATPASTVEAIIDQCIDKKVKAVVVIAAGFAETSQTGKEAQIRIAKKLEAHDILLLGPNTLGFVNPSLHANASFAPGNVESGNIGIISQSGALLTTIFAEFERREVGCSFAISLGNGAGITTTQALEYAQNDPNTKVIMVYLESFDNALSFFDMCKRTSLHKPIITLKGGTTQAGNAASLSHTAALATDTTLLKAASYQMGFVVVDTIEQFFETAFFIDRLFDKTTKSTNLTTILPSNLMILTNAGGPGVNATDLASTAKIPLASWSQTSIGRFNRELPRVKPSNPTDLLGDASVFDIESGLIFAQEDSGIESVILIITPQAVTDIPAITDMLISKFAKGAKPMVVALMGGEAQHPFVLKLREAGITSVEYSNEAVEIYNWVERLRQTQFIDRSSQLLKQLEDLVLDQQRNETPSRQHFPLIHADLAETLILLENYGFTLPRCAIVSSKKQLEELEKLDEKRVYPLIAKTANLKLKHKALVGGIVPDITSYSQAISAYESLSKFGPQVILQEVIPNAIEIILGAKRDNVFGPFIAVGSGGALTNIIADREYVFLPASHRDIASACFRTKIFTLLSKQQQHLVINAVKNFAQLVNSHHEINEIELNPLLLTKDKAYAVDVKVSLQ